MSTSNRQYAERCASAGLHVFPCDPGTRKPKLKWRDELTTSGEKIAQWWTQWPDAVPGIDLAKSGHVVIDGDRHGGPDGVANAEQLFSEHQTNLGAIPTVITPREGRHYWFMQPGGEPLGNSDRPVRDAAINVRGAGGYVIAPGACLRDGRRYTHDTSTPNIFQALQHNTVPVLPEWLASKLRKRGNGHDKHAHYPSGNGQAGKREHAYADAALSNLARELAEAPESGRNIELNNAAFRMGTMMARGWIGRATVEGRLFDASSTNALVRDTGIDAVRATIRSGLDAGEKEPHPDLEDRPRDGPTEKPEAAGQGQREESATPLMKSSAEFIAGFVPPEYVLVGILIGGLSTPSPDRPVPARLRSRFGLPQQPGWEQYLPDAKQKKSACFMRRRKIPTTFGCAGLLSPSTWGSILKPSKSTSRKARSRFPKWQPSCAPRPKGTVANLGWLSSTPAPLSSRAMMRIRGRKWGHTLA